MLDAIARACPSFRPTEPPRHGRKSVLVRGVVDGIPAVAKLVRSPRPDRAWTYYLANEIAVLQSFAATSPPLHVPQLLAYSNEVLVREWLEAAPLSRTRHPSVTLGDLLAPLVTGLSQLERYRATVLTPTAAQRRHMRDSLLEDPADASWCAAALHSAEVEGIVPGGTTARLEPALGRLAVRFAHGDMLLRNVLNDGSVVDWECAGFHPSGWDHALLATQLVIEERGILENGMSSEQRALIVVALCREVWIRARHGDATALNRELAQALRATIDLH